METTRTTRDGLEGVVVAETALSAVDGERGRLIMAGQDVEAPGSRPGVEARAAALWRLATSTDTPTDAEATRAVAQGRQEAWDARGRWRGALDAADGMDALRAGLATFTEHPDKGWLAAAQLVGAAGVLAAAWMRASGGHQPRAPDPALGHAEDVLRMATGDVDAPRVEALETYLCTVMDHGLNASTFAARVVASTGADMVGAVVAGVAALKGPLHGGAPGPVLDMLDAVGKPSHAAEWLQAELDAGRRIMGMGHRIYRVRDPRAAVLERALEALEGAGVQTSRLGLARAVERAARGVLARRHPDRPLHANVEFYTAVLLDAVGLRRDTFSVVFALSRTAGWTAHVMEQRRKGRLIRPDSVYVGPMPTV